MKNEDYIKNIDAQIEWSKKQNSPLIADVCTLLKSFCLIEEQRKNFIIYLLVQYKDNIQKLKVLKNVTEEKLQDIKDNEKIAIFFIHQYPNNFYFFDKSNALKKFKELNLLAIKSNKIFDIQIKEKNIHPEELNKILTEEEYSLYLQSLEKGL